MVYIGLLRKEELPEKKNLVDDDSQYLLMKLIRAVTYYRDNQKEDRF